MFCSTIVPTIGRATLGQAVQSVLDQQLADDAFEVIVVNDSGAPLPDAPWQHHPRVQLLCTQQRERSVARNVGAAVARGRYLHFLDDDDLMLPGALAAFRQLSRSTAAPWLYGCYQTYQSDTGAVQPIRPEVSGDIFPQLVAGESIPFQASLLESQSFFAAGMFDPLFAISEDRDLGRRMALSAAVARTEAMVAQIRVGAQGTSSDWARMAEHERWGREKVLRDRRASQRLRAVTSAYLRGRVSRAYLSSVIWNLHHRSLAVALARATQALRCARWHVFSTVFWKGLRASR